jgi:U2 small nuclear ribonucleoprotein B''
MTDSKEHPRHPEYTPKNTLYIKNLNEKVRVDGRQPLTTDLKQTLFLIFSRFGKVLNITAKHNIRMRGQAFVTFETKEEAREARETLNKALLFKKEMVGASN